MIPFGNFSLDPANRTLTNAGAPVELNARYLDALALLAGEAGQLVTKDRFMAEVWRGVPVTDEALTQCIKTLRRVLGDDAANPRFIQTVPKHGYRFVAPVAGAPAHSDSTALAAPARWHRALLLTVGGTVGGALAGAVAGLGYGLSSTAQPLQAGPGAASVLLVLVCLGIAAGLIAAAGVAGGIALAAFAPDRRWLWPVLGGAAGGLLTGLVARLIGLDAFALLLGRSPGDITGAAEGLLAGTAAGLAAHWGFRRSFERCVAVAGLAGGITGAIIPLLGGRLLGGSLDLVSRQVADSRLRLDRIGALFGESGFGPISQSVTGALEGAVFCGCVVGGLWVARRSLEPR